MDTQTQEEKIRAINEKIAQKQEILKQDLSLLHEDTLIEIQTLLDERKELVKNG